ncbi:hypothetical protein KYC5002_00420 [Archangium violaceum]|uniref:hypothetical protein n=1 Tax=Archangium violaceum TaxID=83451 RepID=UPI002B2F7A2C|nr:hypothetical protein KYC5002_00420 [Archangium gephyra]
MRRLGLPVLLLSLFLAQSAAAQSVDGPFYSRQHLVDYWATQSVGFGNAIHVFLNHYKVFDHLGFGPALGKSYFQCQDGLIRRDCNSIQGPFIWSSDAVAYLTNVFGDVSHINISLDGTLINQGFSPLLGYFNYKTCFGQIYNGRYLTYVVLEHGFAGGTTFNGISCLPQP